MRIHRTVALRLAAPVLVGALGCLLLAGPLAPSASAASATPAPLLDTTFATLLNTLRVAHGLVSLGVDPQLSDIARGWSTQMATSGVMSHNPALTTEVQGWSKLGENVGFGGAVTQIFDALVASPPHMRNMSDPEFTRVGVATVTDAQHRLWTTHVFMRPKGAGVTAAARPAAPSATQAPAPSPAPSTRAPVARATAAPVPAAPAPGPSTAPAAAPAAPAPAPSGEAPAGVAAGGVSSPAEATHPADVSAEAAALASASPSSPSSVPLPLLAGAGLLALLVLCGGGFLLRRRTSRSGGAPRRQASDRSGEDLATVLDLLPR